MRIVRMGYGRVRRQLFRRGFDRPAGAAALFVAGLGLPLAAWAQGSATPIRAPIQVTPYVSEPGVPLFAIPQGTTAPAAVGNSGTTGASVSGNGGSDPLNTLLATNWGITAISEAEALGVNPSALAATCVLESGCTNAGTNGTATGAFQMQPAAFQAGLNTALTANPALASQIVRGSGGMTNPTTEAVAASGYLMQAATTFQSDGVSNPTVLDARSYYEFGPGYGMQVARAKGSKVMSKILPPSFLSQNGISQTETVSQWRATVAAKVGNAATQPVLP